MDYSVFGYMKRRTTEELELALDYYLKQQDILNYENVIQMIQEELNYRKEN